jgi:hypothetical protein
MIQRKIIKSRNERIMVSAAPNPARSIEYNGANSIATGGLSIVMLIRIDYFFIECRVLRMVSTPCGSRTTFVPSHLALLVNSVQSSLTSTSFKRNELHNLMSLKETNLELRIRSDGPPCFEDLHILVTQLCLWE